MIPLLLLPIISIENFTHSSLAQLLIKNKITSRILLNEFNILGNFYKLLRSNKMHLYLTLLDIFLIVWNHLDHTFGIRFDISCGYLGWCDFLNPFTRQILDPVRIIHIDLQMHLMLEVTWSTISCIEVTMKNRDWYRFDCLSVQL